MSVPPPLTRRRALGVLAATAAAAALPRATLAAVWHGRGFGADLTVTLQGRGAEAALAGLPALVAGVEATFSLHRPDSELARLNATGRLDRPSPDMVAVLALCDRVHGLTGGAFDPTVQPLWRALATGGDVAAARAALGWARVRHGPGGVRLAPGQALTLNGVAQGYAADLVRAHLAARGFTQALVDLGEQAALGGPFRLGIEDPEAGRLGWRSLTGRALAASSPMAMQVGGQPHILHPAGRAPLWSTVVVEAPEAALADALSTAAVFLSRAELAQVTGALPALGPLTLVDAGGGLETLGRG
jgi:thiamine biosynthesis lipoprotein